MIRPRHAKIAGKFLRHRFRSIHPFEVQAVLLNACNLACVYCRCPEVTTSLMTTDEWRHTIRGLARLGTMRVKFQGGEPTLRHDFTELAREARAAGVTTAVVTNGIRVAERPELIDDVDEVVVSLDSIRPEIHDRARGQGSHAAAVRAIRLARERGRPTYVVMVVTRESFGDLEPMLGFCESHGVKMHAQPVLAGRSTFKETQDLGLSAGQCRELHTRLAGWKRDGRAIMFLASTYEASARWDDYDRLTTRSDGPSTCMAGRFYVHIEPNGDVHPCSQHGAAFSPKNIPRDGLESALEHARHHDCGGCFTAYLNERKAVFGLRQEALLEVIRRG